MTTAYRRLEALRDGLRDGTVDLEDYLGDPITDLDLTDIFDIIHNARDAARLCSCPTKPQAGTCPACKLREALQRAGAPRQ